MFLWTFRLNEKLGGLHKSDLIILAGRPSMGKTALATNTTPNAAQHISNRQEKSSVAFFFEMSSETIQNSFRTGTNKSDDIGQGKVTENNRYIETH